MRGKLRNLSVSVKLRQKRCPLQGVLTIHPIHFLEIIECFASTTVHCGEGFGIRISLIFQAGEVSEGLREGLDPLLVAHTAAKRPQSRSGTTSYRPCPCRKFCVSI